MLMAVCLEYIPICLDAKLKSDYGHMNPGCKEALNHRADFFVHDESSTRRNACTRMHSRRLHPKSQSQQEYYEYSVLRPC